MTRQAAFLLDHFDKLFLTVALAALAFCGARFLAPPPTGRFDIADLQAKIDRVEAHVAEGRAQFPRARPDLAARLDRRLDPSRVAQGPPLSPWLMHRRPHFFTAGRTVVIPEVLHAQPTGLAADTSLRDRIGLAWRSGEGHAHIDLKPFEVQRAEADPDFEPTAERPLIWRTLGRVDPEASLDFVDRTVRSGRAYRYRVVSIAAIDSEDPAVKEHGLTLDPKHARKRTAVVGPFVPKPTVYVRVVEGVPDQAAALRFHGAGKVDVRRYPKTGRADLRFWVWSPADGFREAVAFGVVEGARIRKTKGRGERQRVVLDTGCTLRRVRPARIDRTAGARTYQVVGVVVDIEGPDGRRWSIVQHQPLPEELARRD